MATITIHLGSTSYLTDTAGNASQFVCYTPYGEAIVDEHLTSYENPFKFSGKELDDITGLYDHGARSRNPISTLWYGVDPRYEEFTEMSPFAYCHGNPVRLVDPDGRADMDFKIKVSFGLQIAANAFNILSGEANLGSIDLISYEQHDKNSCDNSTSKFSYIGKDGIDVTQKVEAGLGLPIAGDISASYGQSFTAHQGKITQKPEQEAQFNADIDVAKVGVSAKCLFGIELEINYNFTENNTFKEIYSTVKEWVK